MFNPVIRQSMLFSVLLLTGLATVQAQTGTFLVDPTAPLQVAPAGTAAAGQTGTGSFELSSILIRGDDRIAVINSSRVRVGDTLGLALVQQIEPDAVVLNVAGESRRIRLYGSSVRSSAVSSN